MDELKQTFRPEFLNRIDGIIVFHPLTSDGNPRDRRPDAEARSHAAAEQEITLEVTEEAMDLLGEARLRPPRTAPGRCAASSRT